MTQNKLHPAWFILLGIIIIRGFAGGGINMTSGLFLAPVASELGVGIGTLSLYFSITSIVMVLWLPFAGKLFQRFDIRLIAAAGALLHAGSFAAYGLLNHVYGWYLLAIPQAMGAVIVVNLLGPVLVNRWFTNNVGVILGIQMAFVGLFGAVLQPATSAIIAADGWRNGYLILGGVAFAVILIATFLFLKNSPAQKGIEPYTGKIKESRASSSLKSSQDISEKAVMRSSSFYFLLVFLIALTGVGVFIQHIPTYGADLGYSLQQIGIALSFSALGSAAGAIIIGILIDKIGCLSACGIVILIGLSSIGCFFFGGKFFALFASASFLHGIVSSAIMLLAPIFVIEFYGRKDYDKIFAKLSMGAPVASILLIPAYGFIYDLTASYLAVLVGMACLLILAFVSVTLAWKKRCTILIDFPSAEETKNKITD